MTRILITGSAQGLGRAAATALLDDGHQVVVHARDTSRAAALTDLVDRGAAVVIGDLASAQQTRHLAEQGNQLGRMDAVIHNAGVYGDRDRNPGPEGHPHRHTHQRAPGGRPALTYPALRRLWSNWSLHEWDRLGSETVHHFPEVDLFVVQAEVALRFARGEKPAVGYRQALRATELADEILSKGRERV